MNTRVLVAGMAVVLAFAGCGGEKGSGAKNEEKQKKVSLAEKLKGTWVGDTETMKKLIEGMSDEEKAAAQRMLGRIGSMKMVLDDTTVTRSVAGGKSNSRPYKILETNEEAKTLKVAIIAGDEEDAGIITFTDDDHITVGPAGGVSKRGMPYVRAKESEPTK